MNNYSVKSFEEEGIYSLELKMESWLYKNNRIEIVNVSHSSYKSGYSTHNTAIVLYRKNDL